ncbi:MAG: ABC transporter permease [Actinomycetes bacterium]
MSSGRSVGARFLRSELRLVFGRRRNQMLLVALAAAPVLIGVAVRLSSPTSAQGAPGFVARISQNGLFLVFTAMAVTLPVLMPLAVAVVAGDSIAGEAHSGTLRYLLVVPVERTRLLVVKYVGIVTYGLVAAFVVAAAGWLTGLVLFPSGPVTLLSGDTVPYLDALGRAGLVALYAGAMLAGLAAIGLFLSTLTEVPIAAMASIAGVPVVSEILDAVPALSAIHPYLFTHWWLAFGDLLREPIATAGIRHGLGVQAVYIAIFGALAWARLTTKDVTS